MNDKQTTESQNARWWAHADNEIERLCTAIERQAAVPAPVTDALNRMATALDKIHFARAAIEDKHVAALAAAMAALRQANESLATLWTATEEADAAMQQLYAAVTREPLPDTRNPL